jgi:hypothetical protein
MKSRLRLDERSFEQLLAAAYVLQQQRAPLRVQPALDETARLAVIADTQTTVHGKKLSLQEALQLVTERSAGITGGAGAAIWLVDGHGKNAVCQAACGISKTGVGQSVAIEANRLTACFRNGEILRCVDAQSDPRARYDALPGKAEGSVLAVPIRHEGRVEGALEITFAQARGFTEMDVRTCQILSGLVSEAVALSAEQEWKQVLEIERTILLDALEKIQPHLSKLLSDAGVRTDAKSDAKSDVKSHVESKTKPQDTQASSAPEAARAPVEHTYGMARLGKYLVAQQAEMPSPRHQEAVEGSEGPGNGDEAWRTRHELLPEPGVDKNPAAPLAVSRPALPREVQTALNLAVTPQPPIEAKTEFPQYAHLKNGSLVDEEELKDVGLHGVGSHEVASHDADSQVDEIAARHRKYSSEKDFHDRFAETVEGESATLALRNLPWLDAETATLDELRDAENSAASPALTFWKSHWADVCLAFSVVMLASSLVWALWPQPIKATATSEPKLTPFEELLVAVGLAEAPLPVVYTGAPGTKVWVDLHKALYYCPGAEPYGKTPKGKFLTQRDAQDLNFQPARGQPCN